MGKDSFQFFHGDTNKGICQNLRNGDFLIRLKNGMFFFQKKGGHSRQYRCFGLKDSSHNPSPLSYFAVLFPGRVIIIRIKARNGYSEERFLSLDICVHTHFTEAEDLDFSSIIFCQ